MNSLRLRALAPLLAFGFAGLAWGSVGCFGLVADAAGTPDGAVLPETGDDVDAAPDTAIDGAPDTAIDGAIDTAFDAPAPPPAQKLLFEAGYQNYAWGFTYDGIYVNAAGEVWSYSHPQTATPAPAPTDVPWPHAGMTETEITTKYASNAKLLTTLSKDQVLAMYKLVSLAETGMLIRQNSCADAGSRLYVAWRYDATTSTYSPVQLGMTGDTTARNTVPAAAQLVSWLSSVGSLSTDFCAPPAAVACVGSGCKPATCPNTWQTAACDGTCVAPTQCESVAGCAACGSSTACLVDAAGAAHCSQAPACSSGVLSCACGGDAICAGGAAWCRGTSAAGFRCERP